MDQRDVEQLYAAGLVANTIQTGDIFLIARKNVQRGDNYSTLLLDQSVLTSYMLSQVPAPPTPFALPYKVYTALLTQSGTVAPSVTVLQNTLGVTPSWSYAGVGQYNFTSTGAFPQAKTTMKLGDPANFPFNGTKAPPAMIYWADANTLQVLTGNGTTFANDQLLYTTVEIRVYN